MRLIYYSTKLSKNFLIAIVDENNKVDNLDGSSDRSNSGLQ